MSEFRIKGAEGTQFGVKEYSLVHSIRNLGKSVHIKQKPGCDEPGSICNPSEHGMFASLLGHFAEYAFVGLVSVFGHVGDHFTELCHFADKTFVSGFDIVGLGFESLVQ